MPRERRNLPSQLKRTQLTPPGVRERGDGVHALHQARVLSNVTRPSAYPAAKRSQHCCGPLWRAPRCPPSPSAASPADLDHAPCTGHPRRHVHVAHLTFLSWEGSSNAVPSPARSTCARARRRRRLYAATLTCAPGVRRTTAQILISKPLCRLR